jgi:hypothetical protein
VGQIITDSSNIPSQFRPAYEGLMAYVQLANDDGGICGRTIDVSMENDDANPTTHYYRDMVQQVFAFVANSSLFDGNDYQSNPPFDPLYKDGRTGEYVPDVGGLALAYGRAQSPMHAGVIGSVSPVLVGGGQFKYFVQHAQADTGHACNKAGVIYLVEPTGASKDQAELGKAALEADWGGGFGSGTVKEYSANLAAPDVEYRGIIEKMIVDGVNCVFSYTDLGSNINLAKALAEEGVWPPDHCTRTVSSQCFGVVWVPFTAYDPKFAENGGDGARDVVTFVPQLPLNETSNPALKSYLDALSRLQSERHDVCPESDSCQPSTYSVLGFASGMMFGQALIACGGAPTRDCVMSYLKALKDFTAGGLLGGTTPFATTRASYGSYGCFDWKWIFAASVALRVEGDESDPLQRWHRVNPTGSGFFHDTLHIARGVAC